MAKPENKRYSDRNDEDGIFVERPAKVFLRVLVALIAMVILLRFGGAGLRAIVAAPMAHIAKQVAATLFYALLIASFLVDWAITQEIRKARPSLGYGFFVNRTRAMLRYHARLFPDSRKRVLYWPLLICSFISFFLYLSLR